MLVLMIGRKDGWMNEEISNKLKRKYGRKRERERGLIIK